MGSIERIQNVAQRIAKWHQAGHQIVVVTSAMSGETNRLLGLADEINKSAINKTVNHRELDVLAATGEQVSVALLAIALNSIGIPAISFAGWQIPILTNDISTRARISHIDQKPILKELQAGRVVIITGFQGVDENSNITTLGRGGSDTSAVAIAAVLKAEECLIYTDVDGVYTTDPRLVEDARKLDRITFEEMLEMASLGSKVLQTRSVEFAGKYQVKTRVLSSLTDPHMPLHLEQNAGTLITLDEKEKNMEQAAISGIAFQRDEAQIAVLGVPDTPGVAASILGPIADASIDVDMIIQNRSVGGKTDFMFTVGKHDFESAKEILKKQDFAAHHFEILGDDQVSKISVIGVGMRSHAGVANKMFQVLAKERINIQTISTSEIKISVLIERKYLELAVRALHKEFCIGNSDSLEN